MIIAPLHNNQRRPCGRCAATRSKRAMEVPLISRKKGLRVEVLDKTHGMNLFTVRWCTSLRQLACQRRAWSRLALPRSSPDADAAQTHAKQKPKRWPAC